MNTLARLSSVRPPFTAAAGARAQRYRMTGRYLGVAISFSGLAYLIGGPAWMLLYPATTCAGVALAYATNRGDLALKSGHLYNAFAGIVLAPYLIGALCSWRWYCRNVVAWHAITPGILIGRRLRDKEARQLVRSGVMAVLDLAPELPESPGLMRLDYKHVPMLDLAPPSRAQLNTAIAFIEAQPPESKLFIHCALGYSRSVAVLAAYLIKRGHDLDAALAQINARRPGIVVPNSTLRVLRQFEHQHRRNLNCPN